MLTAQAEADKIRLIGEAEASSIEVIGKAEALRMKLKAEAYQQYGEAAKTALVLEALPMVGDIQFNSTGVKTSGKSGLLVCLPNVFSTRGLAPKSSVFLKKLFSLVNANN